MTLRLSLKAILLCAGILAFSLPATSQEAASSEPSAPVFGIWENSTRFVEISPEGRMRVILKPYYAFVYEDEGWIPCSVLEEGAFNESGVYSLSVLYPGQRVPQDMYAAVLEDESLYTAFFAKEEAEETAVQALEGFWVYYGSDDGIMLYGKPPAEEFFCLYFEGARYYKIRYWRTDARFTPLRAVFPSATGKSKLSVPKFLQRDGFLYTCVTGTGKTLRNYEQGTWELLDGAIRFLADTVVFAGSLQNETTSLRFSESGAFMLLGEPQFTCAEISDMDAAIAERNATRRPPRKPPVEFMDLDFHWDEVEKLRQ